MNFEAITINDKNQSNIVVNEQEIINQNHILKVDYLVSLLDQLILEDTKNKDDKNNCFQSNNVMKTKVNKKLIFLYLLINFYSALILLTFIFFFIIDPLKIIHN